MKILKRIENNFLFALTIFLLAFIPLYPKLPLLDVVNTWVYVRAEDFILALSVVIWAVMLIRKKITLKTPLTIPILIFWIVGGFSTFHGVLLIFPTISDVFSNVALLSYFRRIEYIFLFFVAFASIKDKKFISYLIYTLAAVLILIALYGFGQKFLGFPAYLTMNEEFAKGIPIQLSQLSRVPSTFAGHYDLAAYLVLMIPILVSVLFSFKNWLMRIFMGSSVILGFALLFMTVSRVSFFVLLISLVMLLFLQRKRLLIVSLFVITILFFALIPGLAARFGNTLKEVDVLVDSKTGAAVGQVKVVDKDYFKDKIVKRQFISTEQAKLASDSAILPFVLIPPRPTLLVEANEPTGEDLPQGTGYINLPLSPVLKREDQYFFEKTSHATTSAEVQVFYGDYVIKRAFAYDLSFTTRFQGEWPKTINAFKRNIFIGSGYASVTLAVDNNYLRILGESGLLGFLSFLSIFLVAGLYIQKILPKVDSPTTRNFVLGFVAGTFGLMLNAIFIDVFEASKVAFTYWLIMGVTLGTLHLYKTWNIDIYKDFMKAVTSPYAVIAYLFITTMALYFSASGYYFTGDDFTWFRWVADCHRGVVDTHPCGPSPFSAIRDLTDSNGFFYRPGTKIYFTLMYSIFWLNQTVYHFVSIMLHFAVAALIFLISKRVLKNYFLSIVTAFIFLVLSGYQEAVFWISSTGFLFNAFFALLSILAFIYWKERGRKIYLIIAFASIAFSLLFHELGVVVPLLVIAYDFVFGESRSIFKKIYLYLLLPLVPYLILRLIAHSHWFSGDYSYNLLKLPYNILGNAIGYIGLDVLGPVSLSFYEALREFGRGHMFLSVILSIIAIPVFIKILKIILIKIDSSEKKIITFAILFFMISLLPFLGLGNITSRYSYLSSFGVVLILVLLIKRVYSYLLTNGRNIAVAGIIMISIIFFSIQLFQLQKVHSDWKTAGDKSKRFLISLNQIYTENSRTKPTQFFFVDVPIRHGEAWVFPVGLEDALWFTFQNNQLLVSTKETLTQALEYALVTPNTRVFQFSDNGGFKEIDPAYLKESKQ
ncbi:MAG: O-antigen ligase family protein [Candidatus Levybacteria bacterium]|nr:O-antigen ligase family protein [Candidatus Levybacteria bacterium]